MISTFDYIRKNKKIFFIVILGFLFFMSTIWPNGNNYCYNNRCGLFFWGSHAHDGIWHIALSSAAFKKIPFIVPVFSGAYLQGYNYLTDLIIYIVSRVGIPIMFMYFKLIPFTWFILYTLFLIILGRKLKDSTWFVFWLLFFSYFGSSFAYIFTLYHQKTIWGSSELIAMQSGQILTNIPFALSLLCLLAILIILKTKNIKLKHIILLSLLISINLGLKVYAGIISLVLVSIFILLNDFQSKTKLIINYLILIIPFLITLFILYNPLETMRTGSIFIFSPFATMHAMIEESVYFYAKNLVNARYFLYAHGGLLSPRLWAIELFSTALFLIFSVGLRMFGLLEIIKKTIRKTLDKFHISIIGTILFGFLFLVLFVQKGEWWNVIQFYYYSLFLLNIFSAYFFYKLLQRRGAVIKGMMLITVVIITLPGNIDILKNSLRFPSVSYLPREEFKALQFLKKEPDGIVLALVYKKNIGVKAVYPEPLYYGDSSSYISAFSEKQTYYADDMQLNILSIPYEVRRKQVREGDCAILKEVNYVYQLRQAKSIFADACLESKNFVNKRIYESKDVLILKIK